MISLVIVIPLLPRRYHLERLDADRTAANGAEMPLLDAGYAAPSGAGHIDQPLLMLLLGRPCKSRHRQGDIGFAARQRALRHRLRHIRGDRLVAVDQLRGQAEQLLLGLARIGDEAPVKAMAAALDVGQQRGEQAAGAAFRGRDGELLVAQPAHRLLGLSVELLRQRRLERFAHPRSPGVEGRAG
jgi:hypothetical protein